MKTILALLLSALALPAADPTVISGSGNMTMSGNITFAAPAPAADTTPPLITSATVEDNGTNVIVIFNEAVQTNATVTGWTITNTTTSVSGPLTYWDGTGSSTNFFRPATTITTGSVAVGYTQPGTGWSDEATNYMVTTNIVALNNSTNTVGETYLFTEDWEGSPGWTTHGTTINQQAAWGKLNGTYSLAVTNNVEDWVYLNTNIHAATTYYGRFRFKSVAIGAGASDFVAFCLSRPGYADDMKISHNPTTEITIRHGDLAVASAGFWPINTEYFAWFEWTKGSGSDGVYKLWISSTGTKPVSVTASGTNGTGGQPTAVTVLSYYGTIIVDDIAIDDAALGSF